MKQGLFDGDAPAIVSMLTHGADGRPVTKLVLSDNDLGDESAEQIAACLQSNSTLTHLSLHKNKISDKGGKAMAEAIRSCVSLKTLWLTGNNLSDATRSELTNANAQRPTPMSGLNGLVLE